MKNTLSILFLLCAIPFLLGMGSLKGESSPERIPVPAQKFIATFIDQTDIVTECKDVSIEGKTFIEGKRGDGTYTISFDKIDSILFTSYEGRLTGLIKLKDGKTVELILQKDHRAYGHTKYGTFQIKLFDMKKMTIGGSLPKRD